MLAAGQIPGVKKHGGSWLIPIDARKPIDLRRVKRSPGQALSDPKLRLHLESEFAYLRGNFRQVVSCYHKTYRDDASRLRACSITIAAAISIGDYPLYLEIESFLNRI